MSLVPRLYEKYAEIDNKTSSRENCSCSKLKEAIESPYKFFDFLVDEELQFMPIHDLETQREQHRRAEAGNIDITVTQLEFAKMLQIDTSETEDPLDKLSILSCSSAKRSYYGDPPEEIFRSVEYALGFIKDEDQWYKSRSLLSNPVVEELFRLQYRRGYGVGVENNSTKGSTYPPRISHGIEGEEENEVRGVTKSNDSLANTTRITCSSNSRSRNNSPLPSGSVRDGRHPDAESELERKGVKRRCPREPACMNGGSFSDYRLPMRMDGAAPGLSSSLSTNFLRKRTHPSTPEEAIFTPDVAPISIDSKPMAWPEGMVSAKQKFLWKKNAE